MSEASALSRRTLFGLAGSSALALAARPALAAPAAPSIAAAPTVLQPPVSVGFAPDPGTALLARNENPYGPAPSALKAIADYASAGCYYANGGEERLRAMIAERHGLTPAHVLIGSGSTEVLIAATMALTHGAANAGGHILAPDLYFDPPVRFAETKGTNVVRVPLAPDMQIDLAAMQAAVTPQTRLAYICNPNNPTGLLLPTGALRSFATAIAPKTVLLVDEAYNELTEGPQLISLADRVRAGDDVIVARTFSKIYGMAGLRVGYALAKPELIAKLKPWTMSVGGNTAGLAAAIASFDDAAFLQMSLERITEARQMIEAAARKAGLPVLKSATNFVYVKVPDAEKVRAGMANRNILIRGPYGKWTEWSRVSCGRIEDVARYAAALPAVVSG